MVEDIAPADGLAAGAGLVVDVVDLDDFNGFDVAVFFQRYGHPVNFAPPVRGSGELGYRVGADDEVGFARGPLDAVIEDQRLGGVGRIALGRAGPGPGRYRLDFRIVQGRIVLEILDADVLFHIPGRHRAGPVPQPGLVFDQAGKRRDLLVSDQGHRADAADPVAVLATALQDRFDIPVESDLILLAGSGKRHQHQWQRERQAKQYGKGSVQHVRILFLVRWQRSGKSNSGPIL